MFDSGVGGLTVARAVIDLLPAEDLIYLGDTARGPYGPREPEEVLRFAFQIVEWLLTKDVKMIVIACNTAASVMLELAREKFPIPIVGVIEPALRSALDVTESFRLGMIGTVGTVQSRSYERALNQLRPNTPLITAACPRFVEFVERGEIHGDDVDKVAFEYLEPLRRSGVDTLVLGCTHYPLLARVISDAVGREVVLISSADETAFDVADILSRTGTGRKGGTVGEHRFVCTGDPETFQILGERFLGPEVRSVERVSLDR